MRKEARLALNIKPRQPLCLHAPERRGDLWLLDTSPRVGRPFRMLDTGAGRFTRTCEIGDEQLTVGFGRHKKVVPTLNLRVGPEYLPEPITPDTPRGIYILLPV